MHVALAPDAPKLWLPQLKVIGDSNPDFRIDPDPDVTSFAPHFTYIGAGCLVLWPTKV